MDSPNYLLIALLVASVVIALPIVLHLSRAHHSTRQEDANMPRPKAKLMPQNNRISPRQPAGSPEKLRHLAQALMDDYARLLSEKMPVLITLHRSEQAFANAENADTMIKRAFWKSGGIRFFSEDLLRRLEALSPEADVSFMRVDVYNSIILPVRRDLDSLLAKRSQLLGEQAQPDARTLIEIQGLTPPKMPAVLSDQSLTELRYALQNKKAALEAACAMQTHTYTPRQEKLLADLLALYGSEDALMLCPDLPEEPDIDACHAAMERLKVNTSTLLADHALPV